MSCAPRFAGLACTLALLALCGSPTLHAQEDTRTKNPVQALRAAFRKTKKSADAQARREAALKAVAGLDSGAIAQGLVRAYRNLETESSPAMQKRREILLKDRGERLQRMRDEIQPLHDLQQRILVQLMKLESADAHAELSKLLFQKKMPLRLRTMAARAAARTLRSNASSKWRKAPAAQIYLMLDAVASLDRAGGEFAPLVLETLTRDDESLREKALDTLGAIGAPKSIEALIDFLDTDIEHRLKERAGRTLCTLTGFDLGPSSTSWRVWLKKEGSPYINGEKRLGGHAPTAQTKSSGGYYFGIPIDRSSILFLHDNSLSMRQRLNDKTRLQASLAELEKALDALKPTQKFNIVLFANRIWAFEKGQIPATKKNVQRAKDWIRYEKLELGTCIYNALDSAFVLAGRGARDRYYDAQVDAIYLLSDGAPTPYLGRGRRAQGAKRSVERELWIRQAVRRWNPFDRIQIHTVLLGGGPQSPARRFMKRLAEGNKGRFVQVGAREGGGGRRRRGPKRKR